MQKRLDKELQDICQNPPAGILIEADDKDRLHWTATLAGPADSPYAGGQFRVNIKFPDNYPFKAPEFQFLTPIFHPNITEKGEVCQEMIGANVHQYNNWQPTRNTKQTLELILNMLHTPNPDQALNQKAMDLFKSDKNKFNEQCKAETAKHAK